MVGEANRKRRRQDGFKRKHDRNKFRKTTNATVHRKDLGNGLKGFLFSCTPHHENQCFRDGVLLLGKFCDEAMKDKEGDPSKKREQSLQEELSELRSEEGKMFTRVDGGVNGAVFVKINDDKIDIEEVVECALRDARQTGNPGSRHCIRLLPIYTTCYAKAEDAAKAATMVVKEHFPKIEKDPVTYAIAFRSRMNSSAKRDDFIPAVAAAVESVEPRYKVNLTAPDVVLLVEVLKTSCCIGVFRHYYQLAKMNLREAASPSKPKESNEKSEGTKPDGPPEGSDPKQVADTDEKGTCEEEKSKQKDTGQVVAEIRPDKRDDSDANEMPKVPTVEATPEKDTEEERKVHSPNDKNTVNGMESGVEGVGCHPKTCNGKLDEARESSAVSTGDVQALALDSAKVTLESAQER